MVGGGVRRVWDVVRVGERTTIMGCCRSGRGRGVRQVWDLIGVGGCRRNMSMGCGRSGRGGCKASMECGRRGRGLR